jgi:hypothetical protein
MDLEKKKSSVRARGRNGGRPKGLSSKYDSIKESVALSYQDNNSSINEIMAEFKIGSRATLYRILRAANVEVNGFNKQTQNEQY